MPTANELRAMGHNSLACAVGRYGGWRHWADRLRLERKGTETHWAQSWEAREADLYRSLGAEVERQTTKAPFDLLVNSRRVDVKASTFHDYRPKDGRRVCGYAFAGLKRGRQADFFHLVCVADDERPLARFVVPAAEAAVHTVSIAPRSLDGGGAYGRYLGALAPVLAGRAA